MEGCAGEALEAQMVQEAVVDRLTLLAVRVAHLPDSAA